MQEAVERVAGAAHMCTRALNNPGDNWVYVYGLAKLAIKEHVGWFSRYNDPETKTSTAYDRAIECIDKAITEAVHLSKMEAGLSF